MQYWHRNILNSIDDWPNLSVHLQCDHFGDLMHFEQIFEVSGNNFLPKSLNIFRQFLDRCQIKDFSCEIILGQL